MSEVYFTNLRTTAACNLLEKLEHLVKAAGIEKIDFNGKFVAVKLHFGEMGNMAYLRSGYIQTVVKILNDLGAKVFLADSNTLYKGTRSNAVDHFKTASRNGFNLLSVDAPVIIADGVKGTDYAEMPVRDGKMCSSAKIGRAFADADIIVSITHFKGHEQTGFGGTLKNIGMGCASVGGKMFLHSDSKPRIDDICVGCGLCVKNCAHDAITVGKTPAGRKAVIDYDKCVGCGQCVATCIKGAANPGRDTSTIDLNKKIAEYTKAVVDGRSQFHISLIMNVSPNCDCWRNNDAAIVPDLGMAASFDPVALDQACADIVSKAPALMTPNMLSDTINADGHHHDGHCCHDVDDKFHMIHPDTCWQAGLEHGEAIGLGSRNYTLKEIA